MITNIHKSKVKGRTMYCVAVISALAAPAALRAQSQCYIDPVTGERVCAVAPGAVSDRAPALDFRLATQDSRGHCRISVADGSTGSGTLIGVDQSIGRVLTCSHLFDSSTQNIIVSFPNSGRFAASLIDRDRSHDLALLEIKHPHVPPIAVSGDEPGGELTACGFGPVGQFRCIVGSFAGQAKAVGATYASLMIHGAVRPGDSGGGVLNSRGELVGVVWGQRDGVTYATCGRPVREFLERIRGRVSNNPAPARPMQPEWHSRLAAIEQRLAALDDKKQDKGDYALRAELGGYLRSGDIQPLDTSGLAQRSEVDGRLKSLSTRFESIHARIETVREKVEQVAASKAGFFQGLSMGKLVVGALGLSGPLAAAVIVAGGLSGRRLKRAPLRVAAKQSSTTDAEFEYRPVVVDSPIPPQRTVPETHYVPIERDSFAKAHQWASEHVARKYPGAAEILQAQDSLIKQFIAAKPER
jgi:hypothetical protein